MKNFLNTISFVTLFLVSLVPVSVVAAPAGGEGLTISPPIVEVTVEPGKILKQTVRISNPTGNLIEFYPRVMDFGAKGESGEPAFFEPTDETRKFSLAKWVTFNQSKIALVKDQIIEFNYTINVPQDAEPGGHYGVVFFASEPPKSNTSSSQVSLGSMIGSLVLVRVPGEIVEKGFIESFNPLKNISVNNKNGFSTTLSNEGNVHFKPNGEITIKSLSGRKLEIIKFNEQNGNVLPDSIRRFQNKWDPKTWKIGRFTAELKLTYGEGEKQLFQTVSFWMVPWWLLLILSVLALSLITGLIIKKSKNKSKNTNLKSKKETKDRVLIR